MRSAQSREAFSKIEESVRQYGTHSRESIYLIRQALPLARDHFVVIWSRGAGVVGFYEHTGAVHGGPHGPWTISETVGERRREFPIDNPYEQLLAARDDLVTLMQRSAIESRAGIATVTAPGQAGQSEIAVFPSPATKDAGNISEVAIFTQPLQEILIGDLATEPSFFVMSVDDATARTMFHMPNLLRTVDRERVVYSNADLDAFAEILEQSAELRTDVRPYPSAEPTEAAHPYPTQFERPAEAGTSRRRWWLALGILLLAVMVFFVVHWLTESKEDLPPTPAGRTPTTSVSHPPSRILIRLPSEIQLFVSQSVYQSRSELDRALALGEGQRYLASTEQMLVLDSVTLAKGVYGYFSVNNAWRKGKLLQTFRTNDTITIDNFLPPLP